MKYKTSFMRIALYVRALYLQKFSKALIHYLILALIFIASTSLLSIAVTLKLSSSEISEFLIFSLSPLVFHLAILLYVSKSFEEFHERRTSSLLLITPASSFEKYSGIFLFYLLSHVLLGTIILLISQLLARVVTEVIVSNYQSTFHSIGEHFEGITGILSNIVSEILPSFHTIIEKFGYFFLSALLFKKHQFIKGILILWSLYSLQAMLMLVIGIMQFSHAQGNISPHFSQLPSQENILTIGSLLCIIIGYFRFSKFQYS